jgi:hypothetical protein
LDQIDAKTTRSVTAMLDLQPRVISKIKILITVEGETQRPGTDVTYGRALLDGDPANAPRVRSSSPGAGDLR